MDDSYPMRVNVDAIGDISDAHVAAILALYAMLSERKEPSDFLAEFAAMFLEKISIISQASINSFRESMQEDGWQVSFYGYAQAFCDTQKAVKSQEIKEQINTLFAGRSL